MAGWGDFLGIEESPPEAAEDAEGEKVAPDPLLSAYEVTTWYQEAAAEVFSLTGEAETEAVRRWLLETILPALLRSENPYDAAVQAASTPGEKAMEDVSVAA